MKSTILLVNPNTSARTLDMMLSVARPLLPPGVALRGRSAERGVAMITNDADLDVAAKEVVRIGVEESHAVQAIVIAAFGNPGLDALRRSTAVPVVGIGEAAMLQAAANGRRFGVATTTPDLVASIQRHAQKLGLDRQFTGVRVPPGDPVALAADPARQDAALAKAVGECITDDGAEAVVIGGGPLSDSAMRLADRFGREIVNPVRAGLQLALQRMAAKRGAGEPAQVERA